MIPRLLCCLLIALLPACAGVNHPPNDCLVYARGAQTELSSRVWSRLLCVRYPETNMGHTYLVYSLPGGRMASYDSIFGSRVIQPASRSAADVTRAADPRASFGWYVEDLPR